MLNNIDIKEINEHFLFITNRGLITFKHIFNILCLYTKNFTLILHHIKKAYLYYVEFIGQIGDDKNTYLQLNSKDATLFVYKKTLFEINNEYFVMIPKNASNTILFGTEFNANAINFSQLDINHKPCNFVELLPRLKEK